MQTFDQASSLDNVDTNAFALSNELSKEAAAQSTAVPQEIYAPNFKADAFNAQLDNAYRSHIENNLPKPEVVQPELRDTLKAAFQSGNVIGSALASQSLAETIFPTKDSPEQTDDQIIAFVASRGLSPYLQRFRGSTNLAQIRAVADDIDRTLFRMTRLSRQWRVSFVSTPTINSACIRRMGSCRRTWIRSARMAMCGACTIKRLCVMTKAAHCPCSKRGLGRR